MENLPGELSVFYETFGEGKLLFVLPGWTLNTRIMAYIIEPFFAQRTGWQRFYIDPPGHGKTPGKPWISNQDKMLDVVLDCIDRLAGGRRFSILGHSLGAYLARGVLRQRAPLVDGLAMLVPAIITDDEKRNVRPFAVVVEEPLRDTLLSPAEEAFFEMSVVRTRRWFNALRVFPEVPEDENGDPDFLTTIREQPDKYAFSFDVDDVAPFPAPSLIVTGRQDAVVGYQDAWNLLDNYPRATFVILDRAGHLLEECDPVLHVLVNEWLDRVEEYAGSA